MELQDFTIKQIHEALIKKEFSAKELALAYFDKIKKTDKDIGAYLNLTQDLALRQAETVDQKISAGEEISNLAGVPCAIKDNILVKDEKCTAASKILENYVASFDATIIKKLKEQDAVFLGKTNLDEFAMGGSTENSAFKVTKNPYDLTCVAGGSSGGSAAAVAANECVYSLGTDTGGSIRQPASFCGVVGFKPTYGTISRSGLIAFASSLDQAGPLAKNVDDIKTIFNAISGKDLLDDTSVNYEYKNFKENNRPMVIGVPKEFFAKGIDANVEKIIKQAISKIEDQGFKIKEISLPSVEYSLACYYILAPSEASANLARFDGIRYGLSKQHKEDLLDVYLESRGQGFGAEVKRRIMLGTYALSSGYYDAYYKKAQEIRELIKQDFKKAFEKVDFIMGPVSPIPAFKIGEKTDDPLSMYLADIYTVSLNMAGLPGLSLPVGKIGALPVGLQIIGNHFEENKILHIASIIEKIV